MKKTSKEEYRDKIHSRCGRWSLVRSRSFLFVIEKKKQMSADEEIFRELAVGIRGHIHHKLSMLSTK